MILKLSMRCGLAGQNNDILIVFKIEQTSAYSRNAFLKRLDLQRFKIVKLKLILAPIYKYIRW